MALYKAEGIVLRTRNLSEADKIVTLFTRERGKVDAVARGSRRPRSSLAAVAQSFTHGRYLLYEGKKDLDTMRQGEIVRSYAPLREDLYKMAAASYVCELTDRTTELKDPLPDVFDLLLAMHWLLERDDAGDVGVRWFELQLLIRLGFGPHLAGCVQCGGEPALAFSPERGGLLCPRCRAGDGAAVHLEPETVEVMRFLAKAPPERLGVLKPSARAMKGLEQSLPAFCAWRVGRPLSSFPFLQSVGGARS